MQFSNFNKTNLDVKACKTKKKADKGEENKL